MLGILQAAEPLGLHIALQGLECAPNHRIAPPVAGFQRDRQNEILSHQEPSAPSSCLRASRCRSQRTQAASSCLPSDHWPPAYQEHLGLKSDPINRPLTEMPCRGFCPCWQASPRNRDSCPPQSPATLYSRKTDMRSCARRCPATAVLRLRTCPTTSAATARPQPFFV